MRRKCQDQRNSAGSREWRAGRVGNLRSGHEGDSHFRKSPCFFADDRLAHGPGDWSRRGDVPHLNSRRVVQNNDKYQGPMSRQEMSVGRSANPDNCLRRSRVCAFCQAVFVRPVTQVVAVQCVGFLTQTARQPWPRSCDGGVSNSRRLGLDSGLLDFWNTTAQRDSLLHKSLLLSRVLSRNACKARRIRARGVPKRREFAPHGPAPIKPSSKKTSSKIQPTASSKVTASSKAAGQSKTTVARRGEQAAGAGVRSDWCAPRAHARRPLASAHFYRPRRCHRGSDSTACRASES